MKKLVKNRFTLVELLVSMAVFSILLVLMMQFFSGARTLWTANEKRAAIYADATVAMDLMSQLLQSTFYNEPVAVTNGSGVITEYKGGTPFAIRGIPAAKNSAPDRPNTISDTNVDGWNSKIYFVSNSPLELSKGSSVRYLSFQRKTDNRSGAPAGITRNVLELLVFSDSNKDLRFDKHFPPFGDANGKDNPEDTLSEVTTHLVDEVFSDTTTLDSEKERKVVLRNVTGLKFTPVDHKGQMIYGSNCNDLPAGIEIELSLMENEQKIREYQALKADDESSLKKLREEFRLKNEYTFRRTVWLGDRTLKFYE